MLLVVESKDVLLAVYLENHHPPHEQHNLSSIDADDRTRYAAQQIALFLATIDRTEELIWQLTP